MSLRAKRSNLKAQRDCFGASPLAKTVAEKLKDPGLTLGMVVGGFVILYTALLSIVWKGWSTIVRQQQQLEDLRHGFESQLESSVQEMAVVDEVARIITSTLEIDEVYERFAQELQKLVNFDRLAINLVDLDTETINSRYVIGAVDIGVPPGESVPLAGTQTEQVINSGQSLIRNDVPENPRFRGDPLHAEHGMRSSLLVPLTSRGQIIGTIGLRSRQSEAYGSRDQAILERLANHIAPAVENAQQYDRAKKEMAVTDEVARIITSTLDIGDVFHQFAQEVKNLMDCDRATILVIDYDAQTFTRKCSFGVAIPQYPLGATVPLTGSNVESVLTSRPALIREDDASDPQHSMDEVLFQAGLRSSIATPLLSKGVAIGVLSFNSRRHGAYGTRESAIAERLANQIAPALENTLLYEETVRSQQALKESEAQVQQQTKLLIRRNVELTRANNAKREFLAHMSHELRTPLNAVLGFARLLTEPAVGPINKRQERYLDNIETSGTHLLQLINDIVDISKIEAGKMDLHISRIDVRECLVCCYTIAAGMASNKGVKFWAQYPPVGTTIYGDDRRIKETLLNLLSNAIKFTPEGGTVLFNASITNEELRISVIDSGIGIDAQYHQQIFDPFDQGNPEVAKIYGGSGLGLYLVKQIVGLHKGEVWLESAVGEGSTFTISLPLAPARPSEVLSGGQPEAESKSGNSGLA